MKVLLIGANVASSPYYVYPLGLSMVATALRKAGHVVNQFDFLRNGMSLEALDNELRSFEPDFIGISMRNIDNVNLMNEQRYIDAVKDIVKNIRNVTKSPVVLGGSAFSIMPEIILSEVGADFGIIGEGESLMVGLVNNAALGKFPEERCIRSSKYMTGESIPAACYDPDIMQFYLKSGSIASLQTKRGCTHKCIYCSYPVLEGSVIRPRNPGAVVDDIEILIKDHKAKYIIELLKSIS